jgi:pyocin large subunit-like protein
MNRKIMRSASLLIIITAVLMCVVSCGGKKSSSESKKPTTTAATVQQTEEHTETESAAEKVSETETAAPTEAATKGKSKKEKKQKSTKSAQPTTAAPTTETFTEMQEDGSYVEYHFRSQKLLNQHFEKHGAEFKDDFGYKTAAEYEKGASDVINDPDALFKHEAEDGDEVYYLEDTNEFVILSTDGYIRTYFRPSGGKKYFDKQ